LKLLVLEDHVKLRDWVRAARLVAEPAGLDVELLDDRFPQPRRHRLGLGM
jgi:hypothetical protein